MSKKKIFSIEDFYKDPDKLALELLVEKNYRSLSWFQFEQSMRLLIEPDEPDPPPEDISREFSVDMMYYMVEHSYDQSTLKKALEKLGYGVDNERIRNSRAEDERDYSSGQREQSTGQPSGCSSEGLP